jgi:hypothetical protein
MTVTTMAATAAIVVATKAVGMVMAGSTALAMV